MRSKTLNQVLAERLDALMAERGLSNNELGRRAKVAPNTIANYRDKGEEFTTKGKPRSAKLAEIEQIADALGMRPLDLLSDGAEPVRRSELSSMEEDLLTAFRSFPDEEQAELVRNCMARAEQINRLVQNMMERRARASPPAETPPPPPPSPAKWPATARLHRDGAPKAAPAKRGAK